MFHKIFKFFFLDKALVLEDADHFVFQYYMSAWVYYDSSQNGHLDILHGSIRPNYLDSYKLQYIYADVYTSSLLNVLNIVAPCTERIPGM